jgi:hypothetical protein
MMIVCRFTHKMALFHVQIHVLIVRKYYMYIKIDIIGVGVNSKELNVTSA